MELYTWQNQCIEEFFKKNVLLVSSCTGSGKTQVAIEIIKKVRSKHKNINILIVVPKIVLIETLWLPKLHAAGLSINSVGVYYSLAHEFSKITLTTMASVRNLDLGVFDFIIADEIHNMYSPTLLNVLRHPFKYKLGLSASIRTSDSRHWELLNIFNYNIYEYSIKQAIDDGIINKFIFYNIAINITELEVRNKYLELDTEMKMLLAQCGGFQKYKVLSADDPKKLALQRIFNERNDLILNYHRKVNVVLDIISRHRGKKVLVFNQYNKIAAKLFWGLIEKDIESEVINSSMPKDLVVAALKKFNIGDLNVLLTSRMLDEGYDIKGISVCVLMASNSTTRQLIQRLGRSLRKKDELSVVYQIYIKDSFEEEYAKTKFSYVEELAEKVVNEEY